MWVRWAKPRNGKNFQDFFDKPSKIAEFTQFCKNLLEFFGNLFKNKRITKSSIVLGGFRGGTPSKAPFYLFYVFSPVSLIFLKMRDWHTTPLGDFMSDDYGSSLGGNLERFRNSILAHNC